MTGNLDDARLALAHALPVLSTEGTDRVVYLSNNVVYKVESQLGGNIAEWDNYNRLLGMSIPEPIRIPRTSLFEIGDEKVIAMEFVDGEFIGECMDIACGLPCECGANGYSCLPVSVHEAMLALDISDLHSENVIRNAAGYWIIDLEC